MVHIEFKEKGRFVGFAYPCEVHVDPSRDLVQVFELGDCKWRNVGFFRREECYRELIPRLTCQLSSILYIKES